MKENLSTQHSQKGSLFAFRTMPPGVQKEGCSPFSSFLGTLSSIFCDGVDEDPEDLQRLGNQHGQGLFHCHSRLAVLVPRNSHKQKVKKQGNGLFGEI